MNFAAVAEGAKSKHNIWLVILFFLFREIDRVTILSCPRPAGGWGNVIFSHENFAILKHPTGPHCFSWRNSNAREISRNWDFSALFLCSKLTKVAHQPDFVVIGWTETSSQKTHAAQEFVPPQRTPRTVSPWTHAQCMIRSVWNRRGSSPIFSSRCTWEAKGKLYGACIANTTTGVCGCKAHI